jgi:hypothetical protein
MVIQLEHYLLRLLEVCFVGDDQEVIRERGERGEVEDEGREVFIGGGLTEQT